MLLQLNKIVLEVDGKPMRPREVIDGKLVIFEDKEINLSQLLGNILYNITGVDDPLKYKTMGEDLYRNGEVQVDESDLNKIEDILKKYKTAGENKEHPQWPACISGPIEAAIRQARNKGIADA